MVGPEETLKIYQKYKNSRSGFISAVRATDPNTTAQTAGQLYDQLNKSSGGGSNSSGDGSGTVSNILQIQNLPSGEYGKSFGRQTDITEFSDIAEGLKSVASAVLGKGDLKENTSGLFNQLSGMAIGAGTDILSKEVDLRNVINSQIGMAGDLSRSYRDEIFDSLPAVVGLNYTYEDLRDTIVDVMERTGRTALFNQKTMEQMAVTSRAFVGDLSKMGDVLRNFEMIGIGAQDALEDINEAGKESLVLGLNAKKTTEELSKNVGKLNEFGFQNGTRGMANMVRKSIEFRMNMGEVFKIAENVMDPEKAISMSANLQAIGGAIGDFNDPLKLMYMATNNVEGLQDALIGVAGSLATYNQEQGRFEITGVNLRKARALAQEMGVDYNELANSAIAAAERSSAATALLSSGLDIDEKQKEFLTNISRMEGGKMVIDIPKSLSKEFGDATRVSLSDLTEEQKNVLLKNQEAFKKMNPEDIARNQFTETQNLALTASEILTILKVQFAKGSNMVLGEVDEYLKGANQSLRGNLTGENSVLTNNKIVAALDGQKYTRKELGLVEPQNKQTQSSATNQKSEVNLNVKANVNGDRMSELVMSNPRTQEMVLNTAFGTGGYTDSSTNFLRGAYGVS